MNDYAYQIQGLLENSTGIKGVRVIVCNLNNFEIVDVPIEVLDHETVAYLRYRLNVTSHMDIRKLPVSVQNKIRRPLGRWLDFWVLEHFYGDTSKRKDTNS